VIVPCLRHFLFLVDNIRRNSLPTFNEVSTTFRVMTEVRNGLRHDFATVPLHSDLEQSGFFSLPLSSFGNLRSLGDPLVTSPPPGILTFCYLRLGADIIHPHLGGTYWGPPLPQLSTLDQGSCCACLRLGRGLKVMILFAPELAELATRVFLIQLNLHSLNEHLATIFS
jgi:hypothetical protein